VGESLLMWESNAGVRGGLHRTAAVVMIAATLFHFVHLATKKRDRSIIPALLPTIKDATDMLLFRYNLGLTKQEAQFAKLNYIEKMEYWAFLWGTTVMALSDFCCGSTISRCAIFRNGSPTPPPQCIGMKRCWLRFPFSSGTSIW
jgi:hypothetical protein